MASERRHLLKPRRQITSTFCCFSSTSLSPTMPMSAVPVATESGMSSSRRKRSSTGKLRDGTSRVRFTAVSLMPASLSSSMVSS